MEKADLIDWQSDESHVLLNPRMPAEERKRLEALADRYPLRAHIWLATSGSSGRAKLCALSKKAILASAAAVNGHLEVQPADVWCRVLPTFHVGGLGIHARASLSHSAVLEQGWDPAEFSRTTATLASLVPAQLFDLVQAGLTAPKQLRAIVVGGASLSSELYVKGRGLGWNLLPSYGMTECASQIATASIASLRENSFPALELLPHLQARQESDGRLSFSGESLLTGYAGEERGFEDPKDSGWLITEDRGSVSKTGSRTILKVDGRGEEFVKIGGEQTNIARLEEVLESVRTSLRLPVDAVLIAVPDERLGQVIGLAFAGEPADAARLAHEYGQKVLPFEQVRQLILLDAIPRSPLGKVKRGELMRFAGLS